MKRYIFVFVLLFVFVFVSYPVVYGDTYVPGYWRSDGTYVRPHYRSDPDSSRWNNYSTKGRLNPYTGEWGSRDPWDNPIKPYKKRRSW